MPYLNNALEFVLISLLFLIISSIFFWSFRTLLEIATIDMFKAYVFTCWLSHLVHNNQKTSTFFKWKSVRSQENQIQMTGEYAILFIHSTQNYTMLLISLWLNVEWDFMQTHMGSGYKSTERNDILLRVRRLNVNNKIDLETGCWANRMFFSDFLALFSHGLRKIICKSRFQCEFSSDLMKNHFALRYD